MTLKSCLKIAVLLAAFAAAVSLPAAVIREIRVEAVDVHFNDTEFVISATQTRPGDKVDPRRISRDVKNLLETGRFAFVDTELAAVDDDYDLIYRVALKPRLEKDVIVEGADNMGERKVRKWLELEPGDAVDDAILSVRSQKVRDEYQKRFYSDVKLDWEIISDPRSGFANVVYRVKEGERASLRKVVFTGNTYESPSFRERFMAGLHRRQAVSSASVPPARMKEAMRPRLWHIFSVFTKRGAYSPDEMDEACADLRKLYLDRGYLDAQVAQPEMDYYRPGKLRATFPVTEGRQYRVGSITIQGVTRFPEEDLNKLVKLRSENIASMSVINLTASILRDYYWNNGYMRASVYPKLRPRLNEPVVDINFEIKEGDVVNIRYVDIHGNTRTKDKVIRRELLVYPGELYNMVKVRQSERILKNLGYFSNVASYPRETSEVFRDDLVFEVEESRTGQFLVGAGYSSIDEVFGFAELSQGNFDLFNWPSFTGGGQKLRLRAQVGSAMQDYLVSFVEPWFLDRKLSLGLDFYNSVRNNLSKYYDEKRLGTAATLGKPIKGFFQRANLRYGIERITIYGVADDAVQRIKDEDGSRVASSMKLTLIRDTRDSFFVPTRGARTALSSRLSGGPLGFDVDMYGFDLESSVYFPLWFGHVFNLRGWVAVVQEYGQDDDVRIFDRLFLGGARMLRGFKYRYVGPYEEGQPIGGKTAAMAAAEYTIPITPKILRAAVFYELGNVWMDSYSMDSEYCSDIGIGARLNIPGFPIRIDYAWPLEINGDVERTSARFNFWLGYGF